MNPAFYPLRSLAPAISLALLAGCGGGGSGSATVPPPSPPPVSTLARIFEAINTAASGDSNIKYLKACDFPDQKMGALGQSGVEFIESLTVETLSTSNAPLYDAQTGAIFTTTQRTFIGSGGKVGAPPRLWTGVLKINADGSASGFGAPCTPGTMTDAPPNTCYWLVDNLNGQPAAIGQFNSVGGGHPVTTTTAILGNPGWGEGAAFYFWYEMGPGATCSAPGSHTLWRGLPR